MKLDINKIESIVPEIKVIGSNDKVIAYEIVSGEYKGITYTYSDIKFNVVHTVTGELADITVDDFENGDEDYSISLSFQYVVIKNDNEVKTTENFKQYIGDILISVVEGNLDE